MSAMIILGGVGSVLIVVSLWRSTYYLCCGVTMWILALWSNWTILVDKYSYFQFSSQWLWLWGIFSILLTLVIISWCSFQRGEVNILWLFVLLGTLLILSSDHWLLVYLGLELQTLSLFVIVVYPGVTVKTTEAGLKFFVLGALSSGLFLFGILGVFMETGTLWISSSTDCLANTYSSLWPYSFLICSVFFKLGVAPFHFWLPDVYQGVSLNNIMLLSTVPKIGAWGVLCKLGVLTGWIVIGALASMIIGAVGAINQSSLFRLVAYSGIVHMGFIIWPLAYCSSYGLLISSVYLMIYSLSVVLWMGPLSSLSFHKWNLIELAGVYKKNSALGLTQVFTLFSLAGVPPLLGFFVKWWVIQQAISESYLFLALFSIVVTVIGAIYYLRVIKILIFQRGSNFVSWKLALCPPRGFSLIQCLAVGVILYAVLGFIINPFPVLYVSQWFVNF
uniref:NADH:ubiquinone reductase (H(+)-translocating) n=1 Tax=Carybdea alata TaxID=1193083 RepID=G9IBX7_CARAL|nr:NADH dehydrogenase subunit 2 [Alatina alata]